jgi:hypothetical protein
MKNALVIATVIFNEIQGKFCVLWHMTLSGINIIKIPEWVK